MHVSSAESLGVVLIELVRSQHDGPEIELCRTPYLSGSLDKLIRCIESCCLLKRYDEN